MSENELSKFLNDPMSLFNKGKDMNGVMEVIKLFFDPKNIETKSEINNPPAQAKLLTIAETCKLIGFVDTAKTIIDYLETRNILMVSYKRQGRTEGVKIAEAVVQQPKPEMSLSERLLSTEK